MNEGNREAAHEWSGGTQIVLYEALRDRMEGGSQRSDCVGVPERLTLLPEDALVG